MIECSVPKRAGAYATESHCGLTPGMRVQARFASDVIPPLVEAMG